MIMVSLVFVLMALAVHADIGATRGPNLRSGTSIIHIKTADFSNDGS